MSRFNIEELMRRGDPGAWQRWDPRALDSDSILEGWKEGLLRRGEPGFPDIIQVYTHFAYCKSTCSFCMYWHKIPKAEKDYHDYVEHLRNLLKRLQVSSEPSLVSRAYCGGGTPSATPLEALKLYFKEFGRTFRVQEEFSFEAHPAHLDEDKLALLIDSGVNRISMGIQSLDSEVLRTVTRKNAPLEHIARLIRIARENGLVFNLDLIAGLPGQDSESFHADVLSLIDLEPTQITLYRYQPVIRHPENPSEELVLRSLLHPDFVTKIRTRGYFPREQIENADYHVTLIPLEHEKKRHYGYALFDGREFSHLIGLGPGAYGHVFGKAWFREATQMPVDASTSPVYWGTPLSREDEMCLRLRNFPFSRISKLHAPELIRAGDVEPKLVMDALTEASEFGLVVPSEKDSSVYIRSEAKDPKALERWLDKLMPSRESSDAAPPRNFSVKLRVQPELAFSDRKNAREGNHAREELVIRFRNLLEIPGVGRRYNKAIVKMIDSRSIAFDVERNPDQLFRIQIREASAPNSSTKVGPFGLSWPGENRALTMRERLFIARLVSSLRQALATSSAEDEETVVTRNS